jgi:predicted  nucleic acid-binding Zn-ribbon protein
MIFKGRRSVHPELKTVIELQEVDRHVADLDAQIGTLPAEVAALETQLRDFLQTLDERKQRLAKNQKERRELEGEIKEIQARISKHRDQLYEVKTNEQYRAMLHEIEGEEGNIRKIEDKILEKMMEADDLESHIREAESRLADEKARVAGETARLRALRQEDMDEREKLLARRKEMATSLSDDLLQVYERVRHGRGGVAVAVVREGFCTECHVALRPQLYNEVRSNESLLTCESCARILYYVEPPAEPQDAPDASGQAAARH